MPTIETSEETFTFYYNCQEKCLLFLKNEEIDGIGQTLFFVILTKTRKIRSLAKVS